MIAVRRKILDKRSRPTTRHVYCVVCLESGEEQALCGHRRRGGVVHHGHGPLPAGPICVVCVDLHAAGQCERCLTPFRAAA